MMSSIFFFLYNGPGLGPTRAQGPRYLVRHFLRAQTGSETGTYTGPTWEKENKQSFFSLILQIWSDRKLTIYRFRSLYFFIWFLWNQIKLNVFSKCKVETSDTFVCFPVGPETTQNEVGKVCWRHTNNFQVKKKILSSNQAHTVPGCPKIEFRVWARSGPEIWCPVLTIKKKKK